MMIRKFTGWHMLATMVAFFGVIAAVNFTMARIAVGTFGGVVVQNSYVASQEFNGWLEQAEAQEELGWEVTHQWRDDGRIAVDVTGAPEGVLVTAYARHPLGVAEEQALTFQPSGEGSYLSAQPLAEGRWLLRLEVASGEANWRLEEELR